MLWSAFSFSLRLPCQSPFPSRRWRGWISSSPIVSTDLSGNQMLRLTPPGTRGLRQQSRIPASTFVELVVTMFLLTVFAALAFPVFWGASKAKTSHSITAAAQRTRLSLSTILPRLCEEVRVPYWANRDKVFQSSGTEWKVYYRNGKDSDFLILRKESESRLGLVTSETNISIDNLNGLAVDWWKQEKRIIGFKVQWQQNNQTMEFHASWGSFIL